MGLVTQMLIFGLLALSTDLLLGHAGLFSLCHASFFAVSAYTVAILQVRYGVPTLARRARGPRARDAARRVFGLAVRTRGVYFILITLALGYVVWGVAHRWSSFTGGDNGVTNVPFPAAGPLAIESHTPYYYFVLASIGALRARLSRARPLAVRPDAARHQGERVAHAQPRLPHRPAPVRRVRALRARSRASPACSTSTTTAS